MNVTIVNDLIDEPEERFIISLSAVPVPPHVILVHPATGEVVITGDDGHTVILLITVTLYSFFVSCTDKPVGVTVLPVNATTVRVSWSGSVHLRTIILYTVYYSTSVMRQYETVYPPGVTSADIPLEDDITLNDVYVHNFTLYYITPDNVTPDQDDLTVEMFDFGIIIKELWLHNLSSSNLCFISTDKTVFQIQFGPFYYCLDSTVSLVGL